MSRVILDLRYGLRALVKHRGLAAAALLTLALAIGANTAVFSLVYGVLLKPLPYDEPDRLVTVWQRDLDGTANRLGVSPGNFDDWRRQAQSFESASAWAIGEWTVMIDGEPEKLSGLISIGSPFELLRAEEPLLGRTFSAEEADRGDRVVVLAYGTWQRLLGGDPAAVGEAVDIDGATFDVIGVMPPEFRFLNARIDFWTPVPWDLVTPAGLIEGAEDFRTSREHRIFIAGARLRPGVRLEEAEREMETLMARLREDHPRANAGQGATVVPLNQILTGPVKARLELLMGAALLVLVIGCVNLANLLLARGAARQREMAVRHSLGAGRGQLVRQLLTESVVLAVAGGLAGLAVGALLLRAVLSFSSWQLPRADEIHLDGPVLVFTLALSAAAGLLFGALPALRLSRDAQAALRRHSGPEGRWGGGVIRGLVVAELALALVLIHGEGLLLRSFAALSEVDPGFRDQGLLALEVDAEDVETPEETLAFFQEVRRRVESLPGVDAAALANYLPLTGFQPRSQVRLVEPPRAGDETPERVLYRVVSPEYFDVMEIPLLRGRRLAASDRRDGSPAVLVDAAFAARFFPGGDPLGSKLVLGPEDQPRIPPSTIVGVVGDVRASFLAASPEPTVYVPQALLPSFETFELVVRPSIAGADLVSSIRAEIRAIRARTPVANVRRVEDILAAQIAPARSVATLLGLFTAVALAMAALGIFGVLSYSVSRRLKELGIRMALGADGGRILRLVMGQGGRLAVLGLGCGLLGALAFGRRLESQLYSVSPRDPATLVTVALLFAAVAFFAVWIPAARATRIDPVRALRED